MTCYRHCEDLVHKSSPTFLIISLRENTACGILGSEGRRVPRALMCTFTWFPRKGDPLVTTGAGAECLIAKSWFASITTVLNVFANSERENDISLVF